MTAPPDDPSGVAKLAGYERLFVDYLHHIAIAAAIGFALGAAAGYMFWRIAR